MFGHAVSVTLLTSNLTALEKREVKAAVEAGHVRVVIGTHALFQEDVQFESLGLVVTDEQHRFWHSAAIECTAQGVCNRMHLLCRHRRFQGTLSLILYGDMDTSVIDVLPKGRLPIKTHFISKEKTASMYEFIEKQLSEGTSGLCRMSAD